MNKLKLFILFNIILLFFSCGTVREGFSNQKKISSDEFLVEKKSPLKIPPEFNELPLPKTSTTEKDLDNDVVKKLITNEENINSDDNKNINENLEESLLEKIKRN
jgi:hypothetical protein